MTSFHLELHNDHYTRDTFFTLSDRTAATLESFLQAHGWFDLGDRDGTTSMVYPPFDVAYLNALAPIPSCTAFALALEGRA